MEIDYDFEYVSYNEQGAIIENMLDDGCSTDLIRNELETLEKDRREAAMEKYFHLREGCPGCGGCWTCGY